MAGQGNDISAGAGRPGHLRASHADREQVIDTLKAAFVQGVLAKDEFDLRVGQTLASRTYAELGAITADMPARLLAAQPPRPARAQGEARVPRLGAVITVVTVVYAALWPLTFGLPGSGPHHDPHAGVGLVGMLTFFYMIFLLMAGAQMLDPRPRKRSGRQPPQDGGFRGFRPQLPMPGRHVN